MVFDFEKAKEDREEMKRKKETQEEKRKAIIDSTEKVRNYSVLLDVEGRINYPPIPTEAVSGAEALFNVIFNAEMNGLRITKKNCVAKDLKTGELFYPDGTSVKPPSEE